MEVNLIELFVAILKLENKMKIICRKFKLGKKSERDVKGILKTEDVSTKKVCMALNNNLPLNSGHVYVAVCDNYTLVNGTQLHP